MIKSKQDHKGEAYQHYWAARTLADEQVNEEEFRQTAALRDALFSLTRISAKTQRKRVISQRTEKNFGRRDCTREVDGASGSRVYGWRGQAHIECELGNPQAAIRMYTEAIRSASQIFDSVPLLLLQGDRLWAALRADDKGKDLENIAEELNDLLDQLPSYTACYPMLMRVANFCKAIGLNAGEQKCRNAAARCFVRR